MNELKELVAEQVLEIRSLKNQLKEEKAKSKKLARNREIPDSLKNRRDGCVTLDSLHEKLYQDNQKLFGQVKNWEQSYKVVSERCDRAVKENKKYKKLYEQIEERLAIYQARYDELKNVTAFDYVQKVEEVHNLPGEPHVDHALYAPMTEQAADDWLEKQGEQ